MWRNTSPARRPTGGEKAKSIIIISLITLIGDMIPTTIAVSNETKEMLRHFGEKGESYDHIVRRLIEDAGWKELDRRWNRILEEDEFISMDDL